MIIVFFIYLILSYMVYTTAKESGKSIFLWLGVSLIFSPLVAIVLLFVINQTNK